MTPTAAFLKAVLRTDLVSFLMRSFRELTGSELMPNWHILAIAWSLTRMRRGESRRLIVTMPPRHLKSIAISVVWVAWLLGRDPTLKIICVSYNSELAAKFARDTRKIMQSEWYGQLFPGTELERWAEMDLVTSKGGGRFATSIGGTLTGRGGDIIIIDAPLKADDANSESARRAANEWLTGTLFTRLDDKQRGLIVMVMQRLHEDDPAGLLLEAGGWDHLNLPAIAEEDTSIPIGPSRFLERKAGDVLHTEREPLEVLEKQRADMGSAAFSAQYQQAPVPESGLAINRAWLRRYSEPPIRRSTDRIVQSWDTASKTGAFNDYSVCVTALIRASDIYILDVYRARLIFPDLLRQARLQAEKHNPHTLLIEDAASVQALIQWLLAEPFKRLRPIACKAEGDKQTRMSAVSHLIEQGSLLLPNDAPWLADFERELLAFPNGKHDDQADALCQLLNWFRTRPRVPLIKPWIG